MNSKPEEDEQVVISCPKCGQITSLNKQNITGAYPLCPHCGTSYVPLDTPKEPKAGDATAEKRE